jgi:hypothetical protein
MDNQERSSGYLERLRGELGEHFEAISLLVEKTAKTSFKNGIEAGKKQQTRPAGKWQE